MPEKTIGYARTANSEGRIEDQIEALRRAGCAEIYTDEAKSGNGLNRTGLKKALAALQPGDTLKVTRLDRLARGVNSLDTLLVQLVRKHINLTALDAEDDVSIPHLINTLNYAPAVTCKTPILRKLAYRLGRFLIRVSGRGMVPSP